MDEHERRARMQAAVTRCELVLWDAARAAWWRQLAGELHARADTMRAATDEDGQREEWREE